MDYVRIGRILRALRLRRGWRQSDLALRAGCHQTVVSLIERGHADHVSLPKCTAVFAAVDARLELYATWRGGDLDRLLDSGHAILVEAAVESYRRAGWDLYPEVTFSRFGERGSIDLLAVHPATRAVAVNEMKRSLTSLEELIRRHDANTRLASDICFDRFGWRPTVVGRILVVTESRTARRVVAAHSSTFAAAYPADTRAVHRWLAAPSAPIAGLWFLTCKQEILARGRKAWA